MVGGMMFYSPSGRDPYIASMTTDTISYHTFPSPSMHLPPLPRDSRILLVWSPQ